MLPKKEKSSHGMGNEPQSHLSYPILKLQCSFSHTKHEGRERAKEITESAKKKYFEQTEYHPFLFPSHCFPLSRNITDEKKTSANLKWTLELEGRRICFLRHLSPSYDTYMSVRSHVSFKSQNRPFFTTNKP